VVGLSLLAVIEQKSECAGKGDNNKALHNTVIDVIIVVFVAGHGLGGDWFREVVIPVAGMVIRMWVLEEVGDPFTERAILARV
jgi:hypothetical protein